MSSNEFRNTGLTSASQDFNPASKRPAMPTFYNSKKDPAAAERAQDEQIVRQVAQTQPQPAQSTFDRAQSKCYVQPASRHTYRSPLQ